VCINSKYLQIKDTSKDYLSRTRTGTCMIKDQDQEFSTKIQDKDKDFTVKDKDQDKDHKSVQGLLKDKDKDKEKSA